MLDTIARSHRRHAAQTARFVGDERGVVAVTFGLASLVMMIFAGLAIDVARILTARTALIDASDATALAVGRALVAGVSEADAKVRGENLFNANIKTAAVAAAKTPVPVIAADPASESVTVDATIEVPLTLLRLTGVEKLTIPVKSEVRYDVKDLEVGVAIDVTGSMDGADASGKRKIDGLKAAFSNFVDQVLPPGAPLGRKVRVGVVPYSAGVNLNSFAKAASNDRSVDGCVTERLVASYSDALPGAAGGYFATSKDSIRDIDSNQGNQGYTCPTGRIKPLTDSATDLKNTVNAFSPSGTTGGHFGAQWAWNLVAEPYAPFWGGSSAPEPYSKTTGSDPKLIKAVIIMTDGVNNVAFRHGSANTQELALCTAMKAKGVRVFSVGFGLGTDSQSVVARDTLKSCASPGPEYFADAQDAAQLDAAFRQFAAVLGKLRINQ